MVRLLLVLLLFLPTLKAKEFNYHKGWQIKGFSLTNDIVPKSFLEKNPNIKFIWAYQDKEWRVSLSKNLQIKYPNIKSLKNHEGFWIKAEKNGVINSSSLPYKDENLTKVILKEGWNMYGFNEDIPINLFNRDDVKILWFYDGINQKWKAYSPDKNITQILKNITDIDILTNIPKDSGFWLYCSGKKYIGNNGYISGIIQKGNFIDGNITAIKLQSDGNFTSKKISSQIQNDGSYNLKIPWRGLTLIVAKGHFFDEYSEQNYTEEITLTAILNYQSQDSINLNLFTTIEASRILYLLSHGSSFDKALLDTRKAMNEIFNISKGVSPTDLDIYNLNSSLKEDNKNLLLFSGTFLKVVNENSKSLIKNRSLDNILSYYINLLESDFAIDGKIDDVFENTWSKMIIDDEIQTWQKITTTIKKVGVDLKIPKYSWAKRVKLIIEDPKYTFNNDNNITQISFRINLPVNNFPSNDTHYTLFYNTQDDTAKAGIDYTSKSGKIVFSKIKNSYTITIPILQQSGQEKRFKLKFKPENDNSDIVITNNILNVIIPKIDDNTKLSKVQINTFALDSIIVDDYTTKVTSNTKLLFMGTQNSNTQLSFLYRGQTQGNAKGYFANIYATSEGKSDLYLKRVYIMSPIFIKPKLTLIKAPKIRKYDFIIQGFDPTKLQLAYTTQLSYIKIPINDALLDYIKDSYSKNKDIKFKVVVDVQNGKVFKTTPSIPRVVQISTYMNPNTTIHSALYKATLDNKCNPILFRYPNIGQIIYAKMDIVGDFKPKGAQSVGIVYNDICTKLSYNNRSKKYDVSLVKGDGHLTDDISTTLSGFDVRFKTQKVTKDKIYITNTYIQLPKEYSVHLKDTNSTLISPRGQNSIYIHTTPSYSINQDFSQLTFNYHFNKKYYLHAKNLPFYFLLGKYHLLPNTSTLKPKGIEIDDVKYVFEYADAHINNTEIFKNPNNASGYFNGSTGINVTLNLQRGDATLHFPKSTFKKGKDVKLTIKNSTIVDTSLQNNDSFSLTYLQNCYASECSNTQKSATLNLNLPSTTIFSDGSLFSKLSTDIGTISWGDKDSKTVFTKRVNKQPRVFIPGFILPTNKYNEIGKYLLGSAKADTNTLYYLNTDTKEAKDGEYLFAGINLGNFADKSNNTLTNTELEILAGDNTTLKITNSQYTKYYIRPSGITGVFNDYGNSLTATIYGYPMEFSSFKFRQTNNVLDDFTKIDGMVKVGGKGSFEVDFKSLALTCSGNFAGGVISPNQPPVVLKAWQVPSKLTTVDFKNSQNNSCSSERELFLGHIAKIIALKNQIELNTFWSPTGMPHDSTVIGARSNQLDGNSSLDSNEDNGGYDIALNTIAFNSSNPNSNSGENWVESNALFGLPFWGANKMSIRMENQDTTKRLPTIVTKEGELFTDGRSKNQSALTLVQNINNHYKQSLSQSWAGVIKFALPVYYNSTLDTSKTPKFLGRTLSSDLIVLETKAGIDYITPRETSMSFGASADFEALKGLKLHVDLSDPNSLKEIDGYLDTYLHTGNILQSSIGELLSSLNIGNKLLKEGLNYAMEEAGYIALKNIPKNIDPFEKLVDLNSKFYSIPAVINSEVTEIFDDGIKKVINSNISDKKAVINNYISRYYALIKYLQKTKNVLDNIPDVDFNALKKSIYSNAFGSQTCSYDNFTKKGFFKSLDKLNKNIAKVNKKIQDFKIDKIKSLAQKASDFTGYDADNLVEAATKVKEWSKDLNNLVSDYNSSLITYFNTSFCTSLDTQMDNIAKLDDYINQINSLKNITKNSINEVLGILQSSDFNTTIAHISSYINGNDTQDLNLTVIETNLTYLSSVISNLDGNISSFAMPNMSANDLKRAVITELFNTSVMQDLNRQINKKLEPVADMVNDISLNLFSIFDRTINELLAKVNDGVNKLLSQATSSLDKIPLSSAKIDGYALFYGDDIERIHVDSKFKVTGSDEDGSFSFKAALDVQNDKNNNKIGCQSDDPTKSNLRAKIAVNDIGMDIASKEMKLDELMFGVIISSQNNQALVKGVFGGISSESGFDFDVFKLYNLGLQAGIGELENYLGAKANAKLDDVELGVSFLLGKVCNRDVISKILPKSIDDFIEMPNNIFNGALVYGEAQVPVWVNGCALTVNVRAKNGIWYIFGPPKTFGGIMGGGAFGKALCIATLGGEVDALAQISGKKVSFEGNGWGAAGVGSCDDSWSSISDSRSDSWCGTGDASFGVVYKDGWTLKDISTSAIH